MQVAFIVYFVLGTVLSNVLIHLLLTIDLWNFTVITSIS